MILTIMCNVPDDWRDETDPSGLLSGPREDIELALRLEGVENVRMSTSSTICGHAEHKDGHCAEMSCTNYIMKHMH